jgi:hypothetical protein
MVLEARNLNQLSGSHVIGHVLRGYLNIFNEE